MRNLAQTFNYVCTSLLTASGDRGELLRPLTDQQGAEPCQSNDRAERGRSPESQGPAQHML